MTVEERARLVAAVLHFALIEKGPSAKRLFRSFYVLDVLHFRETGRTVTGLEYLAGDFGPYPIALAQELGEYVRPDLARVIAVVHVPGIAHNDVIQALVAQESLGDLFSRRELKLIAQVDSLVANDADVSELVAAVDNGAWYRARKSKKHTPIALEETVHQDAPNGTAILRQSKEYMAREARLRTLAA